MMFHFAQKEIKDRSKSLAPSLETGTIDNESDSCLICISFLLESPLKGIVSQVGSNVNTVDFL